MSQTTEQRYKPGDEIILDIFTQAKELRDAAQKVGSFQLEPDEVYLSEACYQAILKNSQFNDSTGGDVPRVFGLAIYRIPLAGYHVRVASRLVMRPGVEL